MIPSNFDGSFLRKLHINNSSVFCALYRQILWGVSNRAIFRNFTIFTEMKLGLSDLGFRGPTEDVMKYIYKNYISRIMGKFNFFFFDLIGKVAGIGIILNGLEKC